MSLVAPKPEKFLVQTMFQTFLIIPFAIQTHINIYTCVRNLKHLFCKWLCFFITAKEALIYSITQEGKHSTLQTCPLFFQDHASGAVSLHGYKSAILKPLRWMLSH